MAEYSTVFGGLNDFTPGGVDAIDDDPKNYVFSNVFDVADKSAPYERVAVGKNLEYVIEAVRAEGQSPWYACAHDEFALCMDGEVEIHLVKPATAPVDEDSEGAVILQDAPDGRKMGRILIRRGHMALLPGGAAYRFEAGSPSVLLTQAIQGPATIERWADICQIENRSTA
ncbi:MAG: hydroxyquinol 1,2-dioxygenase [Rhodospirillaceae bacterium]|nr:hydroxyquinol 1,2-dioxygenase [Rhodospirillaceae bacterium]